VELLTLHVSFYSLNFGDNEEVTKHFFYDFSFGTNALENINFLKRGDEDKYLDLKEKKW
jgi:hypothetical protein